MAVQLAEWLELIEREYLSEFIAGGGAAVKFVIANEPALDHLETGLAALADAHRLVAVKLDSAVVKLHMIQDVFFAIARQLDWEADAQRFVEKLFQQHGYSWPSPGSPLALKEVAEANGMSDLFLRRDFQQWLTTELMQDASMTHDFRIALTQLCLNRLAPTRPLDDGGAPILQWLRGELRIMGPLKSAQIFNKITRHNARAMLRSLCHWMVRARQQGILLTIDVRQLARTAAQTTTGVRYSSGAVMDAYEVLRQLVDDADLFERFFLVVIADHGFIEADSKRSVGVYPALQMRIWDDVRAHQRDNPLAPLVILVEPNHLSEPNHSREAEP